MSKTLPSFSLPLGDLPSAYAWTERTISMRSSSTAFGTGINQRDVFGGVPRCIVCGESRGLEDCHIIPKADPCMWDDMKKQKWIPLNLKSHEHEPRNGLRLCRQHHWYFDNLEVYLRYMPDERKFIFVNHGGSDTQEIYHGKYVGLDIRDTHAPVPSLFIVHELSVRAHRPFMNPAIDLDNLTWQDWLSSRGVLQPSSSSSYFYRKTRPSSQPPPSRPQHGTGTFIGRGVNDGADRLQSNFALTDDVIKSIVMASRETPTWKSAVIENADWSGTAEENIAQYKSLMDG